MRMATYDDANLVLRLYDMRREEKHRAARDWFSNEFKAKTLEEAKELLPPGSQNNANFRMVTSYWDMVASFITAGVLNEELFFESGYEMIACWEKIRDLVPGVRATFQNPLFMKNLEQACAKYEKFLETRAPGTYAAFSASLRG